MGTVDSATQKKGPLGPFFNNGGEGGIRTLDTRLTYTPLAGERLQPLGHFSKIRRFFAPINERARISQPTRIAISVHYKLKVYRRLVGLSGCTPVRSITRNRHTLHLSDLGEVVRARKML